MKAVAYVVQDANVAGFEGTYVAAAFDVACGALSLPVVFGRAQMKFCSALQCSDAVAAVNLASSWMEKHLVSMMPVPMMNKIRRRLPGQSSYSS